MTIFGSLRVKRNHVDTKTFIDEENTFRKKQNVNFDNKVNKSSFFNYNYQI